ncbi:4a-hydroxytetrahydrobiopterin dehydratase [Nocardiopsis ansamitocini]|nr:4a-hydroxytetrahydrobiopterin dehydratase [Nocardiopsis ansamitocini]
MSYTRADAVLARLPGWARDGRVITRTVETASFKEAVDLVVAVAEAAEEANHHPDIDIRYNRVRFALTSHDAGGLTEQDFSLAAKVDVLAAR